MRKFASKKLKSIVIAIKNLEYKILHLYPHNAFHIIYWFAIDKYRFTKILKKKNNVENVRIFKLSNWHLTYRYYVAKLDGKKVFIKRGYKYESLTRDAYLSDSIKNNNNKIYSRFIGDYITLSSDYNQDSYLITEFIEAESLKSIIDHNSINNNEREQIIYQLQDIYKMLIDLNVIHMDINPYNFFVKRGSSSELRVLIFDFGFSIIKGNESLSKLKGENIINDLKTLGGNYKLESYYYDDAYSILHVMKEVEPNLKYKFPNIWRYMTEKEGSMTYRIRVIDNDESK